MYSSFENFIRSHLASNLLLHMPKAPRYSKLKNYLLGHIIFQRQYNDLSIRQNQSIRLAQQFEVNKWNDTLEINRLCLQCECHGLHMKFNLPWVVLKEGSFTLLILGGDQLLFFHFRYTSLIIKD